MAEKMKKISNHVINCNAGPARVPYDVLRKAQEELIYYENTGISVMGIVFYIHFFPVCLCVCMMAEIMATSVLFIDTHTHISVHIY